MFTIKCEVVNIDWRPSPICFKHVSDKVVWKYVFIGAMFFFDLHLTPLQSYIGLTPTYMKVEGAYDQIVGWVSLFLDSIWISGMHDLLSKLA